MGRREGGRQTLNWGFQERRVPFLRSKLPEMIFFLLLDIVRVKGKAQNYCSHFVEAKEASLGIKLTDRGGHS